jgi:hypothetical protein
MPAPATAKAPGQDDLFTEEVPLLLPTRLAVEGKVMDSSTRRQDVPAMQTVCRLKPFTVRRAGGFETILKSGETLKILSAKTATKLEAGLASFGARACRHSPTLRLWADPRSV